MKAVAVSYVIALILGMVVVGIVGYWFVSQGGKAVGAGSQAECDTLKFNYCKGFVKTWDTKCGADPKTSGGCYVCGNKIKEEGEDCEPPDQQSFDSDETVCTRECQSNCKWGDFKCQ